MAKSIQEREATERLIEWIDEHYSARGRFSTLEGVSAIPAQRWKNVYYRRQAATQEMLDFVQKISTDSYEYIVTGVKRPIADGYPFLTAPPAKEEQASLAGRLKWAIREWASSVGPDLFAYLERKSDREISAADWAGIYVENFGPSAAMVSVVCKARPHFATWIVCGRDFPQVDPSDSASVAEWVAKRRTKLDSLLAVRKTAGEG